ncbi:CBS domain-containing protein CBSX5-like protein [Tanacetum coccineum]
MGGVGGRLVPAVGEEGREWWAGEVERKGEVGCSGGADSGSVGGGQNGAVGAGREGVWGRRARWGLQVCWRVRGGEGSAVGAVAVVVGTVRVGFCRWGDGAGGGGGGVWKERVADGKEGGGVGGWGEAGRGGGEVRGMFGGFGRGGGRWRMGRPRARLAGRDMGLEVGVVGSVSGSGGGEEEGGEYAAAAGALGGRGAEGAWWGWRRSVGGRKVGPGRRGGVEYRGWVVGWGRRLSGGVGSGAGARGGGGVSGEWGGFMVGARCEGEREAEFRESGGGRRGVEVMVSLLEAIDCILEGAQNLVIPIQTTTRSNQRKKHLINITSPLSNSDTTTLHNGKEFCWLTQEDVIRFLLNSINVFSPIPTFTLESLKLINTDTLTVHYNDPASSALPLITRAHLNQTSIAVVNHDNMLIGEISPFALSCCDETIAAAVTTLSAGDLMAYLDCMGPPEDLVHMVKTRLQERNLNAMMDLMEDYYNPSSSASSSSDEEYGSGKNGGMGRSYPGRRSEAIVCNPWNSLMAVMVQMIAHRVSYAWVVKEDYGLVGIVTFTEILGQFRRIAGSWSKRKEENIKRK